MSRLMSWMFCWNMLELFNVVVFAVAVPQARRVQHLPAKGKKKESLIAILLGVLVLPLILMCHVSLVFAFVSGCYFLVALVLFVLVVALVPIVSRYTLFHALVLLLSMVITLGCKDFPRCKGHRSGKKIH